jgi:hypothetical protein
MGCQSLRGLKFLVSREIAIRRRVYVYTVYPCKRRVLPHFRMARSTLPLLQVGPRVAAVSRALDTLPLPYRSHHRMLLRGAVLRYRYPPATKQSCYYLWPAGHKWVSASHEDKWVWSGCYAGAVPAGRAGRCQRCFPRTACPWGVLGVWRGWLAYTAPASGAPRGYNTSSASIGIGYPEYIFHTRPSAFK